MKLQFSLLALLLINFSFSQTVIVDKKFKKGLEPLTYTLINSSSGKKLCIQEGSQTKGMSSNDHIKNILSYDTKGNETVLAKDDNLMYLEYSSTGKTIRATEFVAMSYVGKKYKYISENSSTNLINYKKEKYLN